MPEAKILIVDDTRANLVALQVLLKPVEANVLIAESGQQALLLAAENREHIALILLDVLMPVMDGFEVARLLNENENTRSIPIIFITADQDDAHIEEAYLSGAVDYIQKPIRKTALISKVRVFLDLWLLRHGLELEVEQRRLAEHRVEHLATHDPLTNLPNRRGLYEELNELIYRSKRYKYSSAIIYVDLDGFKHVNDHFGHEAGDRLLTQIAANFKAIVRQTDSVARIGGDEFIVLITDIDAISNFGVRLSVDDFGTGFSALSYLKNYPVNTVKIDCSFIMDLPGDKENAVLVQAIIAMAHGLRLEVIAEGVETAEQWEYLKSLDCDFVQGYYFGKPMPQEDFKDFLMAQLDKPALVQS
jgi:predicted signal transduction protein with EAL and GGDEF domain